MAPTTSEPISITHFSSALWVPDARATNAYCRPTEARFATPHQPGKK